MYSESKYAELMYAESAEDTPVIDDYIVDLLPYLPAFMQDIKEIKKLFETEGYELGYIKYYIEEIKAQRFVDTATWGLSFFEKEYEITINLNLSYDIRRSVIKAKMRGQGVTTIENIKNLARSFTNGEIEVIENNTNYYFKIKFISERGIPQNLEAFKQALEEVIPSHLAYEFKYTYTTWNDINRLTWGYAKENYTWESIKSYKEAE